jgi:fumarylacetoacetate (FAA) hydrolase
VQLVTFRRAGEGVYAARAGVLLPFGVVDLHAAAPLVFEEWDERPLDMLRLLDGSEEGLGLDGANEITSAVLEQIGGAVDVVRDEDDPDAVDLAGEVSIGGMSLLLPRSEIKLLAPLPRPRSLRLFDTFEEHVAAVRRAHGLGGVPAAWYHAPVFGFGNHGAIIGPGDDLQMPVTEQLDVGPQVACVVGREGSDIPPDDAWNYIAGFTILNGWTARDLERDEWASGLGNAKSHDFATSLGPAIVTPDELESYFGDDQRLHLAMLVRVNGNLYSEGDLGAMFYTWGQVVAYASRGVTLYPGDVLGSGTVGGGSILQGGTDALGGWVEPDDVVELEVAGLGKLRNRVGY